MKKSLISFLFILILVVVSSCTKNTDINITTSELLKEYQENPSHFVKTYKNKRILLTGTISFATQDKCNPGKEYWVIFLSDTFNRNLLEGLAVSCTFDSNSLGFSKDAEGKVISVSCVFDDVYKSDFTEFIDFKNGKMIEKKSYTDVTSFLNKSPQKLKKQYNSIKTENVILYSNECKKIFFNGFQIICDEKEKNVIQVIIEDKDFRVLKYFGTDMPIQSIKDVIKKMDIEMYYDKDLDLYFFEYETLKEGSAWYYDTYRVIIECDENNISKKITIEYVYED